MDIIHPKYAKSWIVGLMMPNRPGITEQYAFDTEEEAHDFANQEESDGNTVAIAFGARVFFSSTETVVGPEVLGE